MKRNTFWLSVGGVRQTKVDRPKNLLNGSFIHRFPSRERQKQEFLNKAMISQTKNLAKNTGDFSLLLSRLNCFPFIYLPQYKIVINGLILPTDSRNALVQEPYRWAAADIDDMKRVFAQNSASVRK